MVTAPVPCCKVQNMYSFAEPSEVERSTVRMPPNKIQLGWYLGVPKPNIVQTHKMGARQTHIAWAFSYILNKF